MTEMPYSMHYNPYYYEDRQQQQRHVHEFTGSTRLAGATVHNHRFAGMSSQAIPVGRDHIHAIRTDTDFDVEHLHSIAVFSGPSIRVGGGRHVHSASGSTSLDLGHRHEFIVATLIEDPLR
jgi:hypothetical protein